MAKVITKNEKTVVMEISRTELHVYVQSQVNMIDEMDIETIEDQQRALLMLSAVEPLVPMALKETQSFFNEVKKEIEDISWEDDEEESLEGDNNEEENEEESGDQDNTESGQDSGEGEQFIDS